MRETKVKQEEEMNIYEKKILTARQHILDGKYEKAYQTLFLDGSERISDTPMLSDVPSEKIQQLVNEALTTDGAHHKQWYIEKIADKLGLLTIIEHDEGIAP